MDRERLETLLVETFDAPRDRCRVVAREAGDLSDSGQYSEDVGAALSPSIVVDELRDAPDGTGIVDRWNWWIGSLQTAYGDDYERFTIRRWTDESGVSDRPR